VAIWLPSFVVPRLANAPANQSNKGVSMFPSRSTSNNAAQQLRELPVELVVPNPSQPRRNFDEEALQELAGSIGECGVLQPVLVRSLKEGKYQLVAGERRWRAAKIAGLQSIPALVSRYDNLTALEIGLIENMARKDLNPVEEARACATLVREFGLTYPQIGARVGRGISTVADLLRLLKLSDEILELIERGELSWSHGIALLMAKDPQVRTALARGAVQDGWTVQALESRVRASNVDLLERQQDRGEQAQDARQARDLEALNLARTWGDLLGAEVHVRTMRNQQMRMEVEFDFASEGLALADRLVAATSR
jgi:ParB family transcriptional regulator, chromosome partitioning protein